MKRISIYLLLIAIVLTSMISCSSKGKADYNDFNEMPNEDITADTENKFDTANDYSKLIKNITAVGQTKEYDTAVEQVKELAVRFNGYIESSNIVGNGYNAESARRRAFFVFRIPSDKTESFKNDVSEILNITSISETVQNVSQEYYDLEAVIETLSAERDGLLNILKSLDNSTQYDYWIKITERLSAIEQQIAVYQSKLNHLDNKITYSTYSLTVEEVKEYTEKDPETFGKRIAVAFKESWRAFADNSQDFIVGVVYVLPTVLVLGVIATAVVFIVLLNEKRQRKKREDNKK